MTTYQDIIYEERPKGVARITINRPTSYNAFRGNTVEELIHAFQRAGWDKSIGVIVLTGAGDKAFCTAATRGRTTDNTMVAARSACRSTNCRA